MKKLLMACVNQNGLCPDEYKEINPNKWLEAKCMEKLQINDPVALRDTQEWIRVTDELTEYMFRGMYPYYYSI